MPKKGVKSRGNGQGSALRISANNYKAIAVIGYNEKGNPIRRCKSGFKTKTEALAYIPTLKDPNNKKKTPITLMEAFTKWQTTTNITASTMACYRSGIAVFNRIKYIPMESLGIDDFQECIDKCPHGKRTRQNAKTVLNLIYKWAIPRGILPNMNVASFLKVNAEEKTKPKASFTDAQLETLRSADDRVAHAIYIHCYLGFRPSAFLDLKCEDYHGDYFVGGIKTEAGRNRVVTISPKIASYVANFVSESHGGYIFGVDGKKISYDKYRKDFYDCLVRLGIQKTGENIYTPHTCRHTFATLLKRVGGADKDKLELMGHTTSAMLQYYQDVSVEDLKGITNKM